MDPNDFYTSKNAQLVKTSAPIKLAADTHILSSFNGDYFDPFSRLRVSNAVGVFDAQLTYDLQPLLFEQITTANSSIVHDVTNKAAVISLTNAVNTNEAALQTYEWFRYQPGKGQLIFITINFKNFVENAEPYAGYFDGANNGVEFFRSSVGIPTIKIHSTTDNGDETIAQSDWNIDKLNGEGPSNIRLDLTKTQILVIDFQALYVGRVRVGFDIGGEIIYVHEFNHANEVEHPYIATANLPIRVGIRAKGEVAAASISYYCSSVNSEGGVEDNFAYQFSTQGSVVAGDGADTHILSIQPLTTFNSVANRTKLILNSIDIVVTGNQPILWKLCIGQSLNTPVVTAVNSSYSAVGSVTGTLDGTPAIILDQGYVASSAQSKGNINKATKIKFPITLNAAGAVRNLGRITVLVQGIGGTSATRVILNWSEVR